MQEAVQEALSLAAERGHGELTPTHVFHGALGQTDGVLRPLLQALNVSPETLRQDLASLLVPERKQP